jgi:hypothetical protein
MSYEKISEKSQDPGFAPEPEQLFKKIDKKPLTCRQLLENN